MLMRIYQDKKTKRWFGRSAVKGSKISIVGPTFDGFKTRRDAVSTAKALGYAPVFED
jgi:hypothetical protein